MSYIDAGYAVGLCALSLYALALVVRRRRLERRVELPESRPGGETTAGTP